MYNKSSMWTPYLKPNKKRKEEFKMHKNYENLTLTITEVISDVPTPIFLSEDKYDVVTTFLNLIFGEGRGNYSLCWMDTSPDQPRFFDLNDNKIGYEDAIDILKVENPLRLLDIIEDVTTNYNKYSFLFSKNDLNVMNVADDSDTTLSLDDIDSQTITFNEFINFLPVFKVSNASSSDVRKYVEMKKIERMKPKPRIKKSDLLESPQIENLYYVTSSYLNNGEEESINKNNIYYASTKFNQAVQFLLERSYNNPDISYIIKVSKLILSQDDIGSGGIDELLHLTKDKIIDTRFKPIKDFYPNTMSDLSNVYIYVPAVYSLENKSRVVFKYSDLLDVDAKFTLKQLSQAKFINLG